MVELFLQGKLNNTAVYEHYPEKDRKSNGTQQKQDGRRT